MGSLYISKLAKEVKRLIWWVDCDYYGSILAIIKTDRTNARTAVHVDRKKSYTKLANNSNTNSSAHWQSCIGRRAAVLAFNTIEQRNGERLPDYCLHLQRCVQVLEAIKHPHFSYAEEQVLQFIVGKKGKYSQYSQHNQNDMIEGHQHPLLLKLNMMQSIRDKKFLVLAGTLRIKWNYAEGGLCYFRESNASNKDQENSKTRDPDVKWWRIHCFTKEERGKAEAPDNTCILCGEAYSWFLLWLWTLGHLASYSYS